MTITIRPAWLVAAGLVIAAFALGAFKDRLAGLFAHRPPAAVSAPTPAARPAPGATPASTPLAASATAEIDARVATGVLGSDFWLYLDGRLVSRPPEKVTASLRRVPHTLLAVGDGQGLKYVWNGGVLESDGDEITRFEPGEPPQTAFDDIRLTTTRGRHEVLLMTPGFAGRGYPFAVTRRTVTAAAGGPAQVTLAVPLGLRNAGQATPPRAALGCPLTLGSQVAREEAAFQSDPLASTLMVLQDRLRNGAVHGPTVRLALPPAMGGTLEYDADQVSRMTHSLRANYIMNVGDPEACRAQLTPASRADFDDLMEEIRQFDAQLESLQAIPGLMR